MKLKIATALVAMLFSGSAFAGPVTISQADRAAIQAGDLSKPEGVELIDEHGNFLGYVAPDIMAKVEKAVSMGIGRRKAAIQITGLKKNVPHQRRTEFSADEAKALAAAVEVRDTKGLLWGLTSQEIAKEIEDAVTIGIERPTAIKRFTKWRQPVLGNSAIPVSPSVFAAVEAVQVSIPTIDQQTTADLSKPPVIEMETTTVKPDLDL